MKLHFLAVIALTLMLGGCVETRFESTPGDRIEACDARWKGLWIDNSPDASERPMQQLAFHVDEACRFMLLERPEKNGPLKPIHIPLNFVHDRGVDYVVVADNQLSGTIALPPVHEIKPAPTKSFFIARYRISGNKLEIHTIDSKRAARMIIDETLKGTVSSANSELHVYVQGNRAKTLELLRTQSLFSDQPVARLERSKQTLREFERQHMPANRKSR